MVGKVEVGTGYLSGKVKVIWKGRTAEWIKETELLRITQQEYEDKVQEACSIVKKVIACIDFLIRGVSLP